MPHFQRYLLAIALTLLPVILCPPAQAMPVMHTSQQGAVTIGNGVLVLEDPGTNLSLEDVQRDTSHWKPDAEAVFNRGYSASAWWLAFDLDNPGTHTDWLLETGYAPLDYIDLYIQRASGSTEHIAMGDKLPFSQRPVFHRYFVVPLTLQPNEQVRIYLRLQSTGSMQAPIHLWKTAEFHAHDIGLTAMQGLYYGGLLLIALYNLLIYAALRERYYLYYVGWVASMSCFMISLHGWAFQFLWPNATHWNDTSIITSLSMVVLFGYLFTGLFLGVPDWSRRFFYGHYAGVAACLLLCAAGFLLSYTTVIRIIIPFAAFGCLWGLMVGTVAVRRQVPSAKIYLIAWTFMLVGGIVMALNKVHLLPRNLLTDYAVQLGSLLEVLLLSFALAARINQERQLRLAAQNSALETQQRANEELEQRVQERTEALEQANLKLQELSDTDQLTGLKNRRFLNAYIDREFARAQRYQHSFAVLMIDVDHFKSVNDNYGHQIGDDCLHEVAERIRREMRWPSDTAARYGGEEFCVVLPETALAGALVVAERIRHKIESDPIATRSQKLSLTVSVGLQVSIPSPHSAAADFIAAADTALYDAKQRGRNRVIASSDNPSA